MMGWSGRKVRYIPQMEALECGAACLSMVMHWHGCEAPLSEVRVACDVNRNGSHLPGMIKAAESYGFEVGAYSLAAGDLQEITLPAIIHWGFNHFVVLESVRPGQGGTIADPAVGRRRIGEDELRAMFTGVAIEVLPLPDMKRIKRGKTGFGKFKDELFPALPAVGMILLASLSLQVLSLVFPVANQILIDKVLQPKQESWLWAIGIGMGIAILANHMLIAARANVMRSVQRRIDEGLMLRFVRHMLRLPMAFFVQRSPGDLLQRISMNESVRSFLAGQGIMAILDSGTILAIGGLLLAYDFRLGLIAMGLAILRFSIVMASRGRGKQYVASELAAAGKEFSVVMDMLVGIETTKAARAEQRFLDRWHGAMAGRINAIQPRRMLEMNTRLASMVIQSMAIACIYWIGGNRVMDGRLTMGGLMAFFTLQAMFIAPLESLVSAVWQYQSLASSLDRLDDVLDARPEADGTVVPGELQGEITLENVSFAYSRTLPPTVVDISLDIRPGERIALVGKTGAGKSTLSDLLLGLHVPTAGRILFDGVDLRDYKKSEVRKQMGVVQQDNMLFDGTIRSNIAMGHPDASFDRVREVAALACIAGEIETMPAGYSTMVGEGGSRVSGGQRQRICIARALVGRPRILLMDEATSALDLDLERQVHANLAQIGCTRIVVAHRIATVMDADRVIVLDGGRVVQMGPPGELKEAEGLFRTICGAFEEQHALR